jgi:hypothetical protein
MHKDVQRVAGELGELRRELREARDEARERAFRSARRELVRQSPEHVSASFQGLSEAQLAAAAAQLERWGRLGGARAPGSGAALDPLLRAAVRLAQAGVLNRYDLVDELALAYSALPPVQQQEHELEKALGAIGQTGLQADVVDALELLRQEDDKRRAAQVEPPASSLKRPRPAEERAAEPQTPPLTRRGPDEIMEGLLRAERELGRLSRQISGSPARSEQAESTPLLRSVASAGVGGAASQTTASPAGATTSAAAIATSASSSRSSSSRLSCLRSSSSISSSIGSSSSSSSSSSAPVESDVVTMSFSKEPWPASSRFKKHPLIATTLTLSAAPGGRAAGILAQVVGEHDDFRFAIQQAKPGEFKAIVTATVEGRVLAISTGLKPVAFTIHRLESVLREKGLQVRDIMLLPPPPLCRLHQKPCVLLKTAQGPNTGRSFYTCAEPSNAKTKSSECTFLWSDGFEYTDKDWRERSGLAVHEEHKPQQSSQQPASPNRTQQYVSPRATPQRAGVRSPDQQPELVMTRSAEDQVAERAAAAAASNRIIEVD